MKEPERDWTNKLEVGDVLRTPTGDLRVVRLASHHIITSGGRRPHWRSSVCLTIKHCSWTTRCYTVLNSADLKTRGFRPTGKRVRLQSRLDAEIRRNFGVDKKDITLHCCDVEGIG